MAIDRKAYTKTKHAGIKVHNDGMRFWFDFKLDGKRYNKLWEANPVHSKADRLKTAYQALEEAKAGIKAAEFITADLHGTVNTYFDNLKANKSNWSEATLKKYELYYEKHIKPSLGKLKIKEVKPSHFTSFNRKIAHLAPASQKRAYEILMPLFELAVEDELLLRSPIKKTHVPKRNQLSEKKVITGANEKFRTIHQTINTLFDSEEFIEITPDRKIQCSINPHHKAIFLLGFYGRRLNEVLSLEWNDMDFTNNKYRVKRENSKVNQDMVFALPIDVKEALLQFVDTKGSIFNINEVNHYYQAIRDISGIQDFTFHWMRNLAVSALAANGADVTHLSAMLGHNDAGTLKKYLSLQREVSTVITNDLTQRLLA